MKPSESEETRKDLEISLTRRDYLVIDFRSFDFGKFGHGALIYLKLLNVASEVLPVVAFDSLFSVFE